MHALGRLGLKISLAGCQSGLILRTASRRQGLDRGARTGMVPGATGSIHSIYFCWAPGSVDISVDGAELSEPIRQASVIMNGVRDLGPTK